MNDIPRRKHFSAADEAGAELDAWSRLMALAEMIEIDKASGVLTIRNGESRVVLRPDGVIRVEGRKIIQSARENIAIEAAYIDLN